MMMTQWKAKVGDRIHVRTEYNYGVMKSKHIKTGVVVKSERHDPANTFRLYTGNPQYPVSLIAYDRVTGVKLRNLSASSVVMMAQEFEKYLKGETNG